MLTPPSVLCALLFAAGEPLEKKRAAALLDLEEPELSVAIRALSAQLEQSGLALIETDDALELRTSAEVAPFVKKLREHELTRDLGKASLETLAAIAYRAGSTRGEVDWVRGVNSSASIRTLLMRGLIEGSEDPRDKRRIRYRLTTEALAHLGHAHVEELPRFAELSASAATLDTEPVPTEEGADLL